jgi:F-type H+-transporting ATPase subunit epsilon
MEEKISLEIISPERLVVSEEVDEVTAPGAKGEFGVLPGHTLFITTLDVGPASYRIGKEKKHLFISGGIADVGPDKVTILADVVEKEEDIDVDRAEAARERAEARLAGETDEEEIDFERARIALQKALIRIQIVSKDE